MCMSIKAVGKTYLSISPGINGHDCLEKLFYRAGNLETLAINFHAATKTKVPL